MTIPSLVSTYQKVIVETSLRKFHSQLNQALRMSVYDNGDIDGWDITRNRTYSYRENLKFMQTYILPYFKHGASWDCTTTTIQTSVCTELLFGGMMTFSIDKNGGDIVYYPFYNRAKNNRIISPKTKFQFQFSKFASDRNRSLKSSNFVEPYTYNWDGDLRKLNTHNTWGCRKGCTNCGYCTKIIQLNGWRIPKDYPW